MGRQIAWARLFPNVSSPDFDWDNADPAAVLAVDDRYALVVERPDQLGLMADDSAEALGSQYQSAGEPPVCLIGALPPATHLADVAADVFKRVFDAIGRQHARLQLVRDVERGKRQQLFAAFGRSGSGLGVFSSEKRFDRLGRFLGLFFPLAPAAVATFVGAIPAPVQRPDLFFADFDQGLSRSRPDISPKRFRAVEELPLFLDSFVSIVLHWWFPWFLVFTPAEPSGSAPGKSFQNCNNSRDAAQKIIQNGVEKID